jgi:hypothetical protein
VFPRFEPNDLAMPRVTTAGAGGLPIRGLLMPSSIIVVFRVLSGVGVGDAASVEATRGTKISTDESLLGGLVVAINDSPYRGEWFSAASIERLSVVMPLTPQAAS